MTMYPIMHLPSPWDSSGRVECGSSSAVFLIINGISISSPLGLISLSVQCPLQLDGVTLMHGSPGEHTFVALFDPRVLLAILLTYATQVAHAQMPEYSTVMTPCGMVLVAMIST